jgi:hypothetical protein
MSGIAVAPYLWGDVTHPLSPHSVHVTGPEDLAAVGDWSRGELYATVEAADERDRVTVVDYGRDRLYLVADGELDYRAPDPLGRRDPALAVADPLVAAPDGEDVAVEPGEAVTVAPEFDVLVPAFDLEELDEEMLPVEPLRRPTSTGTGAGTGSPM